MLTYAQEKTELVAWVRRALQYFDAIAEGCNPTEDEAGLFAEGQVCLRRLEKTER